MQNCNLIKNLWKIGFVQHSLHTGTYRMGKKQQKSKVPESISKEDIASSPLKSGKDGKVLITISAKPGAKVSEITEVSESSIGISISAPPVDGEANTQLLKFLSQVLGVKKSDLCLESGSRSRSKVVSVSGVSAAQVEIIVKESASKWTFLLILRKKGLFPKKGCTLMWWGICIWLVQLNIQEINIPSCFLD